jgi:hypothetical protein
MRLETNTPPAAVGWSRYGNLGDRDGIGQPLSDEKGEPKGHGKPPGEAEDPPVGGLDRGLVASPWPVAEEFEDGPDWGREKEIVHVCIGWERDRQGGACENECDESEHPTGRAGTMALVGGEGVAEQGTDHEGPRGEIDREREDNFDAPSTHPIEELGPDNAVEGREENGKVEQSAGSRRW